ncbi:uncharacterized protein LOC116087411 isoform X4 [Mastomys coucha]|uniref:uncharacterized protein LOC116087411 isoform X4 n=1 Tax=Mastomys coucha TaxID=35658 RepID=UPI001261CC71|nr:uncharacterized protein LOC116087411 isoform X4 [Mastomys coucha]
MMHIFSHARLPHDALLARSKISAVRYSSTAARYTPGHTSSSDSCRSWCKNRIHLGRRISWWPLGVEAAVWRQKRDQSRDLNRSGVRRGDRRTWKLTTLVWKRAELEHDRRERWKEAHRFHRKSLPSRQVQAF